MKKNSILATMLLGGLFLSAPAMMAQNKTVKLTTSKSVGTPMRLLVNNDAKKITVDWGDGVLKTYETVKKDGMNVIEGNVKGTTVSISGNANWDMLGCSDCGVTAIDLSQAKDLRSLYCRHNELTSLDLKGMTKLEDLDCSYNQINALVLSSTTPEKAAVDLASIENLNVSNNKLSGKFYMVLPTLQHLDVSNNQIKYFYVNDANVKSVNCANNDIRSALNLKKSTGVNTVICTNNSIHTLTFAEDNDKLTQLVCDDNTLSTLDISMADDMSDFSCSSNNLKEIVLPKKAKMLTYDASDNKLTFSALPMKGYQPKKVAFEPQENFSIAKAEGMLNKGGVACAPVSEDWNNKKLINLRPYSSLAGERFDADYSWYTVAEDGSEKEMSKRTSSTGNEDFYTISGKFAFFTPQKRAYVKFVSKTYGFEIQSEPIVIGDDVTAVEQVVASDGLQVTVGNGVLTMSSHQAVAVNVVTVSGKQVWQGTVKGNTSVNLPKGVYVVNGQKVIL